MLPKAEIPNKETDPFFEKRIERQGPVDIKEMAEILLCTTRHIYGLVAKGQIHHYRIGSKLLFNPSKVLESLERKPKNVNSQKR